MSTPDLSRRHAIAAAAAVGLGVPGLAACSSDSTDTATDPTGSSEPTGSDSALAGGALASTADLTVGGAIFLDDPSVVITEPADGEFKAFSRTCTHQGCPVQDLVDGNIHCSCHNSMFSIVDGSPVSGPAQSPLAAFAIKVEGDQILPA